MSIALAHEQLGWPRVEQILEPSGAGPGVFSRLAQAKIGANIQRRGDAKDARVGILASNPSGAETESPLAIVCEFSGRVSDETLAETHKLAWISAAHLCL